MPSRNRPLRQHVETGGLFGDEYRLALRQDQHLGREIADRGAAGKETEQHERVVVKVGRPAARLRPAGAARDIGAEHMVGRRDPLIADLLGRLDKLPQCRGPAADIDDRQGYTEFHTSLRLAAR